MKLGNLREVLAYGFYYSSKAELKASGRWRELKGLVRTFLSASGLPIAKGCATCCLRCCLCCQCLCRYCCLCYWFCCCWCQFGWCHLAGRGTRCCCLIPPARHACPRRYNPDLKFMMHLWEPLRYFHRPLVFYAHTGVRQ